MFVSPARASRTPLDARRTSSPDCHPCPGGANVGDDEADPIIGYRQSGNVVVTNGRKSRIVSLRRVATKRLDEVRPQLERHGQLVLADPASDLCEFEL